MRQARYQAGSLPDDENPDKPAAVALYAKTKGSGPDGRDETEPSKAPAAKRDFFGRIIMQNPSSDGAQQQQQSNGVAVAAGMMPRAARAVRLHSKEDREIWVSFHEGFSNAVRKPITLEELIKGF